VMPYAKRLLGTPTLMVVAEGDDHTHWDLAGKVFDAVPGQRKRLHVVPKSGLPQFVGI
jgi:PhoPQ-activated pathogenicity-related protein